MAPGGPQGDPRLAVPVGEGDVRPIVARASRRMSGAAIVGIVAVLGLLLFVALESGRSARDTVATNRAAAGPASAVPGREAPPLYVPPAPQPTAPPVPAASPTPVTFMLPPPPTRQPQIVYVPQPAPPPQPYVPPPMAMPYVPPRGSADPALVLDLTGSQAGGGAAAPAGGPTSATIVPNLRTTVPQGTIIAAVMETALDSTRPGFARAIVSRDVRGFDGTRILIPRGSRLIGDYAAGATPGQNRIVINWSRLVRPDGVAIDIASPATDALGRAGVRARVNNHLLERIFPALLSSALTVGVNLASPRQNGSIYISPSFGGGAAAAAAGGGGGENRPVTTLTIPAGTSIGVFVSRDLDFTGMGNPR